jgi:hypothetical protein
VSDWEWFLREVPWFLEPGLHAEVDPAQPWTRRAAAVLPELSTLLAAATLTPVRIDGAAYELLAWGRSTSRRGWLCHPPQDPGAEQLPQIHRDFWRLCGGIVERFGEPDSWWLNQNEVLTVDATRVDVADVLGQYRWLWDDAGLTLPIDPRRYYAVAVEANGNLTLAHRKTGRLLLFAPDHAFTGVTPLAGCPPYSLLTIDTAADLAAWIEACAARWR